MNTGLLLVMDIVIAAVGIALVSWNAASRRREVAAGDQPAAPVLAGRR